MGRVFTAAALAALMAGLLLAAALCAAAQPAPAPATTLARVVEFREATVYGPYAASQPRRADDAGQRAHLPLKFPYPRDRRTTERWWVRIPIHLESAPAASLAVYIANAAPGASVSINGVGIGASVGFGQPETSTWYFPLYVHVPGELLRAGDNELLIEMRSPSYDEFWIGPVQFGDETTLYARYLVRLGLQGRGVELVCVLIAEIGAVSLMLWLRRREEKVFGWFALSCGLWILRNAQFFVTSPGSLFYLWLVTDAAFFWLIAVLYIVSFRILESRFPRLEKALYAYAALTGLGMYLAGPAHKFWVTAGAYALLLPSSAAFGIYLTRRVRARRTTLNVLLWVAAAVTSMTGIYDLVVMVGSGRLPGIFSMPYASLFYAATVGWALVDRFVGAHRETQRLNAGLERRVRERETQLAEQYAASAALEREHTITAERDRIVRDMHDGLGLQLVTAKRLVETGQVSHDRMAQLLSDAMDELRIAIDSMKPTADDLLVMLGDLRYRLEPRMLAAGIRLEWSLGAGDEIPRLSPAQVTELTRIVQEACANVIKHARASVVRLGVEWDDATGMTVRVADDGVGFDPAVVARGEGLRNLRRRAERIGAALSIESGAGGTAVRVTLPRAAVTALGAGAGSPTGDDRPPRTVSGVTA